MVCFLWFLCKSTRKQGTLQKRHTHIEFVAKWWTRQECAALSVCFLGKANNNTKHQVLISTKTHTYGCQNQWYHFGVGAHPILVYLSGDWDVHWGYVRDFDPWPYSFSIRSFRSKLCTAVAAELGDQRKLRPALGAVAGRSVRRPPLPLLRFRAARR